MLFPPSLKLKLMNLVYTKILRFACIHSFAPFVELGARLCLDILLNLDKF